MSQGSLVPIPGNTMDGWTSPSQSTIAQTLTHSGQFGNANQSTIGLQEGNNQLYLQIALGCMLFFVQRRINKTLQDVLVNRKILFRVYEQLYLVLGYIITLID